MLSKGADDEVIFSIELLFEISICDLIGYINDNLEAFVVSRFPTETLWGYRKADGGHGYHLSDITTSRLDEPIIVTVLNGNKWVIDGNHRLERRRRDGISETTYVYVPEYILSLFRAPFYL